MFKGKINKKAIIAVLLIASLIGMQLAGLITSTFAVPVINGISGTREIANKTIMSSVDPASITDSSYSPVDRTGGVNDLLSITPYMQKNLRDYTWAQIVGSGWRTINTAEAMKDSVTAALTGKVPSGQLAKIVEDIIEGNSANDGMDEWEWRTMYHGVTGSNVPVSGKGLYYHYDTTTPLYLPVVVCMQHMVAYGSGTYAVSSAASNSKWLNVGASYVAATTVVGNTIKVATGDDPRMTLPNSTLREPPGPEVAGYAFRSGIYPYFAVQLYSWEWSPERTAGGTARTNPTANLFDSGNAIGTDGPPTSYLANKRNVSATAIAGIREAYEMMLLGIGQYQREQNFVNDLNSPSRTDQGTGTSADPFVLNYGDHPGNGLASVVVRDAAYRINATTTAKYGSYDQEALKFALMPPSSSNNNAQFEIVPGTVTGTYEFILRQTGNIVPSQVYRVDIRRSDIPTFEAFRNEDGSISSFGGARIDDGGQNMWVAAGPEDKVYSYYFKLNTATNISMQKQEQVIRDGEILSGGAPVQTGDIIRYTIPVTNDVIANEPSHINSVTDFWVWDPIPTHTKYVAGSAKAMYRNASGNMVQLPTYTELALNGATLGVYADADHVKGTGSEIHLCPPGDYPTVPYNVKNYVLAKFGLIAPTDTVYLVFDVEVGEISDLSDSIVIRNIAFGGVHGEGNWTSNAVENPLFPPEKPYAVKRADPEHGSIVKEGQKVHYIITLVNPKSAAFKDQEISDVIPPGMTLVPGTITAKITKPSGKAGNLPGVKQTLKARNGDIFYWPDPNNTSGEEPEDIGEIYWNFDIAEGVSEIAFEFDCIVDALPSGVETREILNRAYYNKAVINDTIHYQYSGAIEGVKRSDPMTGTTMFEHDEIIYYIDVINHGADTKRDIPVTDQLPDNTVFVDFVDCGQPGGKMAHHAAAHNSNTDFSWKIDEIKGGEVITVAFKVKVLEMPTNIAQREFRNVAYVNHINTNETEHYQYNWMIQPLKRALPPTGSRIHEGATVKYYIDVTNKGADVANNIVVTDQIPDGMTYVTNTGTTGANFTRTEPGATGKGEIKWVVKAIQPNETITIEFDVKADKLPDGELWKKIVNVAYADKIYSNEVEHEVRKDMLKYDKTAIPPHDSTVEEHQTIRYNIHVENNGDMKGREIVITDEVPAGTTLVAGTISHNGVYDPATRIITWTFDTFSIGQKEDLLFEVTVDPLGFDTATPPKRISSRRLENYATVDGGVTNVTYHHVKKPVLEYHKDSKPVTGTVIMENEIVTYTIMVKNVGTLADKSVEVIDNIPVGTRYVPASLTGPGAYKTNPNRIEWTIERLEPGQTLYLTYQAEARPLAYGLRQFTIENTAYIYGYDVDGEPTETIEHYVYANRLWAEKSAIPKDNEEVNVGEQIEYTIKVINKRGEDAYFVPIADTIPVGTTYVPGSASDGGLYDPVGRRITWVVPYIQAYDENNPTTYTHEVTFKVTADSLEPGVFYKDILNMALVGEGGTKTDPGIPTIPTNEVTHIIIEPEIQPSKTANPLPNTEVNVGDEITYIVKLQNNTDKTIVNVPVKDVIPEGTTYKDGSVSHVSEYGGRYNSTTKTVSWVIPKFDPKENLEVTFVVVVNELPYGKSTGTVKNKAYCGTGGGTAANPGEATIATEEVMHIVKLPPVTGVKSSDPLHRSTVVEGQTIKYFIEATNMASVAVRDVKISDSIPAGTTFANAPALPYQGVFDAGANKIEWTIPSMAAGETVKVEFHVTANSLGTGVTTRVINNTAVVSGTATNYIQHTVEKAKIFGTKSSVPASGSYVMANDKITYTIEVKNDGATTKDEIIVTDQIPAGTTYIPMSGTTLHGYNFDDASGVISWRIVDLAAGDKVTLKFEVTVNPLVSGDRIRTVYNTAKINGLSTNTTNHTIYVAPYFGVKSADPEPGSVVKTDDIITYTIVVRNTDRVASPMLNITDSIPMGTAYVADSAKLDVDGTITDGSFDPYSGMVMWSVPKLDPDKFVTVTFKVKVLDMNPSMTQRFIDNVGAVNTAPTNTVTHIQENALLEMVKSSDPVDGERVATGQTVTYFVEVTNNNSYAINNVEIADFIPAGTTYANVASDTPVWDAVNKKLTWTIPTIAGGASKTVSFQVTVDKLPADMASSQIMNVALVNGIPTNRITHEVKKPLIVGKKTAYPVDQIPYTVVNEGQIIRYAITLKNIGEINDYNVRIKDLVPEHTTLLEDSITHGGVVVAREIEWTIPMIENNREVTVYFSVSVDKLPDGLATRLIKNTGLYGQGGDLPEIPTNETVHIVNKSEIDFRKYASPAAGSTVPVGSTIKYTISLHNKGILKNENTVITDAIPAGTKFVVGSIRGNGAYDAASNSIEWVVSNIGAGATEYIGFDVIALESALDLENAEVKNVAYIDNAPTEEVKHKIVKPNVFIEKSANPEARLLDDEGKVVHSGEVAPGDEITYKLTVKNNNPSEVVFVPITDVIPKGTTYVPGSVSHDGIYAPGNTRLRWVIPVMAPGEELELTFVVTVDELDPTVKRLEIPNLAMYGQGGGTAITPGIPDIETNEVIHIAERPHISAEKTASPASGSVVQAGTPILFAITIHNFGPEDATNVVVTDRISEDFDLDLGSISPGGSYDSATRTISWTGITVAKLDNVEYVVSYTARPRALANGEVQKVIYNTGRVNNKNTNTTQHTVVGGGTQLPDLRISKAAGALHPHGSKVVAGDTITYNITVSNYGVGTANNVTVNDVIPLGTTYVAGSAKLNGSTAGVSSVGSAISWNVGDLASGASAVMTFDVKVNELTGISYRRIENTATAVASNSGIKYSEVVMHEQYVTDDRISATKEARTDTPLNGNVVSVNDRIYYTINVKNETASTINNVTVTDVIQAGATYVPGSGGTYNSGIVTWTIPSIAGGATVPVYFAVYADGSYTNIYNKATARTSTSVAETNQTHHILNTPITDLKIEKTAEKPSGSIVNTNDTIVYTIEIINRSATAVTNIDVFDRIPTGTSYQTMSAGNSARLDGNGVRWTIARLEPGARTTVDFTVKVTAASGDIYNTAQVNNISTNTTIHHVGTTPNAALKLYKSSNPSPGVLVRSGEPVTYYLTLANTGTTEAKNVKIEDVIPAGTTYVPNSATMNGNIVNNAFDGVKLTWDVGSLAANDFRTLSFQVIVNSVTPYGWISNQATGTSDDGSITSNIVTHPVPVGPDPDVIIIKESDPLPGPVYADDLITYTIKVRGTSTTQAIDNVTVTDYIPAGTEFVSAVGGTFTGNAVMWDVGTINPGITAELKFTVRVLNMGSTSSIIRNRATVTTNKGPKDSNEVQHTFIPNLYDIVGIKTSTHPAVNVNVGDTFDYIITVHNYSASEVKDITVMDTVPVGATYVSGGTNTDGTITWTIPSIAAGGHATVSFKVTINGDSKVIENIAYITQGGRTRVTNKTRHELPDRPTRPLIIDKSLVGKPSGSMAVVGEILTYNISVFNNSGSTIENIAVSDMIPIGTEYVAGSATDGGAMGAGNTLYWTIPSLAPGAEKVVSFQVKVLRMETPGGGYWTVENTAKVNNDYTRTIINYVTNDIIPNPYLVVNKSSNPAPGAQVKKGDIITYFISATNIGNQAIDNVVVTDMIPQGTSYNSGSATNGGTLNVGETGLEWRVGTLAANGGSFNASFTVTVTDDTLSSISNMATITGSNIPSTNTNTVIHYPKRSGLFSIEKDAGNKTQVAAGELITYTINVENISSAPVHGVVVSDDIPSGTTFHGDITHGGSLIGNTVVWNLGTLAPGQKETMSFVVKVNENYTFNTITNVAKVAGGGDEEEPPPVIIVVVPIALRATKSAYPTDGPVNVGDVITYTIEVINDSTIAAQGVVITDNIPSGTAYVEGSVSPGGTPPSAGTITWNIGTMQPGARATVSFQVTATQPNAHIRNRAAARATGGYSAYTNETYHYTGSSNVNLTKWSSIGNGSQANEGQEVTYYLTAQNTGTSVANDVKISDIIPAEVTYVSGSASPAATQTGNKLEWTIGTLQPNQSVTVSFRVVPSALPSGMAYRQIDNVGTVSYAGTPGAGTITRDSNHVVFYQVGPYPPAIAVVKSSDYPQYTIPNNRDLTYFLDVTNTGGTTAQNVMVYDLVPTGTTLVNVYNGGTETNGEVSWTIATLAPGETKRVAFTVNTGSANTGSIINTARAVHNSRTTISNTIIHQRPVENVNYTVSKRSDKMGQTVAVGDTIKYFIDVTNIGDTAVTAMHVYDTIPYGTVYKANSANPYAVIANDTLDWTIASIAQGQTVTLSFEVTVTEAAVALVRNVATATVGTVTRVSNEVVNPLTTPPIPRVSTVKRGSHDSVITEGSTITYYIDVTNTSSVNVENVVVTDATPANTTITSVINGTNNSGIATWNVGTLTPGETKTVSMVVRVNTGTPAGTVINNIANVTYTGGSTPTNNYTVVVTGPVVNENFSISKRSDKYGTVSNGETVKYFIDVTNTGNTTLNGMHVYDQIPTGTTYRTGSASPAASFTNGALDWTLGAIAPGQTVTVSFEVSVTANTAMIIRNIATGVINNTTKPSNEVTVYVGNPYTSVQAVKRGSHTNPVKSGDTIVYYIDVTNYGTNPAENVVVTDTAPGETTLESVIAGTNNNGVATWSLGTLAPGQTKTVSMIVKVKEGLAHGTIINNFANVTYTGGSTVTNNYTVIVTNDPVYENFTVGKRSDKTGQTVRTGDIVKFYVDVTNNSNRALTGVHVFDAIPYGSEYVNGSANPYANFANNALDWTIASIAPGQTVTVSFDVRVTATQQMQIRNSAMVYTNTTTKWSNEVVINVNGDVPPVLQVIKTGVHASQIKAGSQITYNIEVVNNSSTAAENVVVTDSAPANTTITSVIGGTNNNGVATWNVGTLAPGQRRTVSMVVTVNNGVANGTVIDNVANVTYTGGSTPSNHYTVIVVDGPDYDNFNISKRSDKTGQNVKAGDIVKFYIDVTNTGSKAITNMHVFDAIPGGTEYVNGSANPSASFVNNSLDWTIASIAPGQTVTVSFDVRVTSAYAMQIRNIAQGYTTTVSKPSNEVIIQVIDGGGTPWLNVTKSGVHASKIEAGSQIVYNIDVVNSSSVAAENVVVTDVAPANTTLISVIGGTNNNGTATWNLGTLAPGQRRTVSMIVTVNSGVASGTVINNIANVTYTGGSTPSNNYTVIVVYDGEPDYFNIVKRSDKTGQNVKAGDIVKFYIDVTNTGSKAITNMHVYDVIPAGTTYLQNSAVPSASFANNALDWTISSIAPGQTVTLGFDVTVTAPYEMYIRNTATGYTPTTSKPSNEVIIHVIGGGITPWLQVTKSGVHASQITAGSQIVYNIDVVNNSSVAAENVVVTDTAPANTTITSVIGGTNNNGVATWNVGTLAPGQRRTVSMIVTVNNGVANGTVINNVANVTYTGGSTPSNNYTVVVVDTQPRDNFNIVKRSDKTGQNVTAGDIVKFYIDVTNTSSQAINGMQVYDTIPSGTEYVNNSANPSASLNGSTLNWIIESIAPGQTVTLSFDVRVTATYAMQVRNIATGVTNTTSKPSNEVVINVTGSGGTNVQLNKTGVHASQVTAGSQIVYNIEVVNNSAAAVENVVVTDTAPANTTITSVIGGTNNNGVATWNIGTLAAGQRRTVTMIVTVNNGVANGTVINNVANVTYTGGSTPSNNYTVIVNNGTDPDPYTNFTISKRSSTNSNVNNGDTITYYIDVRNVGNAAINGMRVVDAIPYGTTYQQGSANPYANFDGSTLDWTLNTLAPNQTVTLSFSVQVTNAQSGSTIRNTATGTAGNVTRTSNEVIIYVGGGTPGNVTANKQASSANAAAGSQLTYYINVTNNGTSAVNNVVVTDAVPTNTTYAYSSNGGTLNNGIVTWNIGTLNAGETRTVNMTVTVNSGVANGTVINNMANITYTGGSTYTNNVTTIVGGNDNTGFNVSKRTDKYTANNGDIVKYYIDVTNTGNTALNNVQVSDYIPYGATYQQGSANPYANFANNSLTWTIQYIAPGQTATVSFDVRVSDASASQIRNTATVTVNNVTKNTNEVITNIGGGTPGNSYVSASKRSNVSSANAGSNITFYIDVKNNGQYTANNVVVSDTVPYGTTYQGSNPNGTLNNGVVTWQLGSLAPGQSTTVAMTVRVNNGVTSGTVNNQAIVTYSDGSTTTNTSTVIIGNGGGCNCGNNCNCGGNNGSCNCGSNNNCNCGGNSNNCNCGGGNNHTANCNCGSNNNNCNCGGNNNSNCNCGNNNNNACNCGGNSNNCKCGGGTSHTAGCGCGTTNDAGNGGTINNNNNNITINNNVNGDGSGASNVNGDGTSTGNNSGSNGSGTTNNNNNNNSSSNAGTVPKTNQDAPIWVVVILIMSAAAAFMVFVVLPKRKKNRA